MTDEVFNADLENELGIIASEKYYSVDAGEIESLMVFMNLPETKKTRIIVTGSSGKIGSILTKKLKENTKNIVFEFDRRESKEAYSAIDMIKRGYINYVIHLAGQDENCKDLGQIRRDNIDLFINLALTCQKTNTKLIYLEPKDIKENATNLYELSVKFCRDFSALYSPIASSLPYDNDEKPESIVDKLILKITEQ